MSEPTHYLNIVVGVDFGKILSPEMIQGVKFMLNAETNEEVVSTISKNITIDIEKALLEKREYASIIHAEVSMIPEQAPEQQEVIGYENEPENEPEYAYDEDMQDNPEIIEE